MGKTKEMYKRLVFPLACGLSVILIFQYILMIGYVPSSSMEPTISKDSYILGLRIHKNLKREDIVIFNKGGQTLVKRIAAIPGDMVYINDGNHAVSVNQEIVATRVLKVGENSYFVLGDNVVDSLDSRYWEEPCVSVDCIAAVLL